VEEIETMKGVQGMHLTNGITGSMGCQETEEMNGMQGSLLTNVLQGSLGSQFILDLMGMDEMPRTNPLPLPGIDCLVPNLLGTNE
jgi:hypothetical protein